MAQSRYSSRRRDRSQSTSSAQSNDSGYEGALPHDRTAGDVDYGRGEIKTPAKRDSRGQMQAAHDASGRYIPTLPEGQRRRSYYKKRQSFTPVEPFKRDRHGRLHDALGRWMSDTAAPGEGPEGTPSQGARDDEQVHLHANEAARSGQRSSSSRRPQASRSSRGGSPSASKYGQATPAYAESTPRARSSRNNRRQEDSSSSRQQRRSSRNDENENYNDEDMVIDVSRNGKNYRLRVPKGTAMIEN